jgi:hypothetical protein
VTLAALCEAVSLDMDNCGQQELNRIDRRDVIEKIRAKHSSKPEHLRKETKK